MRARSSRQGSALRRKAAGIASIRLGQLDDQVVFAMRDISVSLSRQTAARRGQIHADFGRQSPVLRSCKVGCRICMVDATGFSVERRCLHIAAQLDVDTREWFIKEQDAGFMRQCFARSGRAASSTDKARDLDCSFFVTTTSCRRIFSIAHIFGLPTTPARETTSLVFVMYFSEGRMYRNVVDHYFFCGRPCGFIRMSTIVFRSDAVRVNYLFSHQNLVKAF